MIVFFFKQKTAYEMRISDWSSDVCSSDLRRCVDDMELVRAMALIRQYRPSAQVPIGPEIVFRHMHIPVCINYGLCVLGLRDADPGDEGYDCSHGNDSGAEHLHGCASSDRKAHVCTPVTNAHLVCRLLLETK